MESSCRRSTIPDARDRLTAELERRKEEAQDALPQTALWQQVLNDGIADLTADVDHDLRGRFRPSPSTPRRSSTTATPRSTGPRSAPNSRTRSPPPSVTTSCGPTSEPRRSPQEVARTFTEAGLDAVEMPEIDAREMGAGLGEMKSLAKLEAKPIKAGHKVVTGMRGSYGGVLMFGMLTSFAGLGMFNPLSLGAGFVLGRKAYKEDMENRMLRVRNEAKTNVRRFVDDVSFVVSKESRDRLKGIQRQLRDHYRGIANQTTRSLNESLQATSTRRKWRRTSATPGSRNSNASSTSCSRSSSTP